MAITSELIGKLGGGDVGEVPVSIPGISGQGTSKVMHTVNILPGETWLVAVVGTGTAGSHSSSGTPQIIIGGKRVPQYTGYFASSAVMTESGDVALQSNSFTASSFDGHVYTVKL